MSPYKPLRSPPVRTMSVICAVKFADGVVTRMTVFDYSGDSLDIGRALALAVAAYENRMKRPPPLITTPESIAGAPDIVGYQWMTADGKISSMTTPQNISARCCL